MGRNRESAVEQTAVGRRLGRGTRNRIVELRKAVPWLSLRRLAAAFGVSLHEVRKTIAEGRFARLKTPRRCGTCGRTIATAECLACRLERRK
jgi:hypothetical protein